MKVAAIGTNQRKGLFFFGCVTRHAQILVPQPGIEPVSPAVEGWTAREFPERVFFMCTLLVPVEGPFLDTLVFCQVHSMAFTRLLGEVLLNLGKGWFVVWLISSKLAVISFPPNVFLGLPLLSIVFLENP